jgi:hypothetical protein
MTQDTGLPSLYPLQYAGYARLFLESVVTVKYYWMTT